MRSPRLTLALIQTSLSWEDKAKNLAHFSEKIRGITFDCDVILLPEMFTTGFTMNAGKLSENMDGPTMTWFKKMASETGKVVTGSFIAKEGENHFNRLVWMRSDGDFSYYDKKHLFRMAGEHQYYAPGETNIVVELKGWKIRPLICYDLRFPVWSRNRYSTSKNRLNAEYDVLIYVANWPAARSLPWDILLKARAVENQAYCIGVNRVGPDGNGNNYSGHSAAISPKGEYILEPVHENDGIYKVVMDYNELQEFREKFPLGYDADEFSLTQ